MYWSTTLNGIFIFILKCYECVTRFYEIQYSISLSLLSLSIYIHRYIHIYSTNWSNQAISFSIIFSLHLESIGSPLPVFYLIYHIVQRTIVVVWALWYSSWNHSLAYLHPIWALSQYPATLLPSQISANAILASGNHTVIWICTTSWKS